MVPKRILGFTVKKNKRLMNVLTMFSLQKRYDDCVGNESSTRDHFNKSVHSKWVVLLGKWLALDPKISSSKN